MLCIFFLIKTLYYFQETVYLLLTDKNSRQKIGITMATISTVQKSVKVDGGMAVETSVVLQD